MTDREAFEGHCTCGQVRYRMSKAPMFVHCCHCRWCQRETGTAFALNGLVESREVTLLQGQSEIVDTPSNSGKGQRISRCPAARSPFGATTLAPVGHPFRPHRHAG